MAVSTHHIEVYYKHNIIKKVHCIGFSQLNAPPLPRPFQICIRKMVALSQTCQMRMTHHLLKSGCSDLLTSKHGFLLFLLLWLDLKPVLLQWWLCIIGPTPYIDIYKRRILSLQKISVSGTYTLIK